jgi:hypothetical protein
MKNVKTQILMISSIGLFGFGIYVFSVNQGVGERVGKELL